MSTARTNSEVIYIDSTPGLISLLDSIKNLATEPPSLYMAVEGDPISDYDSSLRMLSLYISPLKQTYLIALYSLGGDAFSTTTDSGTSLKTVLESPTIAKVIFDLRNAANSLFDFYQVSLDGIKDLQLMELASRSTLRASFCDLAECLEQESIISAEAKENWHAVEDHIHQLFGSGGEACQKELDDWPFGPLTIQYYKQHVALLPDLYAVYYNKLQRSKGLFWQARISEATANRIKQSRILSIEGFFEIETLGWDDQTIDQTAGSHIDTTWPHATDATPSPDEGDQWVTIPRSHLHYDADDDGEAEEEEDDDWDNDTAQEHTSWEEDLVMDGEKFI